jgi:hypothetical protein
MSNEDTQPKPCSDSDSSDQDESSVSPTHQQSTPGALLVARKRRVLAQCCKTLRKIKHLLVTHVANKNSKNPSKDKPKNEFKIKLEAEGHEEDVLNQI